MTARPGAPVHPRCSCYVILCRSRTLREFYVNPTYEYVSRQVPRYIIQRNSLSFVCACTYLAVSLFEDMSNYEGPEGDSDKEACSGPTRAWGIIAAAAHERMRPGGAQRSRVPGVAHKGGNNKGANSRPA